MRSTTIIRKVDELGRVVIPTDIRKTLKFESRESIEIYVEDNRIILKKYNSDETRCMLTGKVSNNNFTSSNGSLILSFEAALQLLEKLKAQTL